MAISLVQRILGKTPCAGVHRSKGFTLIELLVVLAILTMLAGLVGLRCLTSWAVPSPKRPASRSLI